MTYLKTAILAFSLLLGGCVSTSQPVPPDSLALFRDRLVDLNVKSIQAMTFEYEWNYQSFRERIKTQDRTDPAPLTLRFCGGDYEWQWGDCGADLLAMPAFNVIAKSRDDLARINQAMIDYANFLVLFNSANEDSGASLEAAAGRIGASTTSVASRFGVELNQARVGAFADLGASAVNQLLAKKQRGGMAAVMSDFQPGVRFFATLGSQAMAISATGIKEEYNNENRKTARAIAVETDGSKRLGLVEKLLKLNEQTSGQLDSLSVLGAAYDSLPNAHDELITALRGGQQASLSELVGNIELIGNLVQTYQKPATE